MQTLSAGAARRIALAAGGFGARREEVARRHLVGLNARLGAFQIDSVNVLARAHLMPAYSRLGPYALADFESAAWGGRKRAWVEYWGHEACLIPVGSVPLLRWRMRAAAEGRWKLGTLARFGEERAGFIAEVVAQIRDRGAMAASEIAGGGSASGAWWGWSDGKCAMEHLFAAGVVTVARRRGAFERVYDLVERVWPAEVLAADVPEREGQLGLLRIAAAAMGVMTERDLRAYWRLPPAAKALVEEMVAAGELLPVAVEGWERPGLLWHAAKQPRRVDARALVSPFDPLLWERERALAVFGFHYRIGLYTPKEKRVDGYYVLPFLLGDRIAAKVDLKADRKAGVLRVHGAWLEAGDRDEVASALDAELEVLAGWLGLQEVKKESSFL